MSCLTIPKHSHPALFTHGLATPPLTPTSPATPTRTLARAPTFTPAPPVPVPSYAQLRAGHVHAVRYVISKLRWEQKNNLYLAHQDAQWNHDRVIDELEKELQGALAAQERLDRFPNCFAPVTYPKPHGPRTKEEDDELIKLEAEKAAALNEQLEKRYPFIKQLFVGPMTKDQYKRDKLVRERLQYGIFDDIEMLLLPANLAILEGKAKFPGYVPKKPYEQIRLEKEKEKFEALNQQAHKSAPNPTPAAAARRIGPLTKEEYLLTLPVYGPKTKNESMLPKQREHRHEILDWFRRPWGKYDEEAAQLIEQLAQIAKQRTEEVKKEKAKATIAVEQVKEKK